MTIEPGKNYCANCKHFVNEFNGFSLHSKDKSGKMTKEENKGVCISPKRNEARNTTEEIVPKNYTCFYHEKQLK